MVDYDYLNGTSDKVESKYCGQEFQTLVEVYKPVHGVITTVLCPIGILTNIVNIVVLTRKNMSHSPTNVILTSMALADMLFLISTFIYNLIYFKVIHLDECVQYSFEVQVLTLFSKYCALTTTRISLMLTFISALWRYLAITFPLRVRQLCSLKRTYVAIVFSYIFVPLTTIGFYLSTTVVAYRNVISVNNSLIVVGEAPNTMNNCWTLYGWELTYFDSSIVDAEAFAWNSHRVFWVLYNVFLPIVVFVVSIILIRSLYVSHRQHLELAQNSVTLNRSGLRTTRMLLAVLLLFFITEIPRGVFLILREIPDYEFLFSCYFGFLLIMELLDILNSTLNFVIYVTMSTKIRKNFLSLISPCVWKRTVPHDQRSNLTCTTHM